MLLGVGPVSHSGDPSSREIEGYATQHRARRRSTIWLCNIGHIVFPPSGDLTSSVGDHRVVGSPAPDTGRYQHEACTNTEIFNKGPILPLCADHNCPNKGANWL